MFRLPRPLLRGRAPAALGAILAGLIVAPPAAASPPATGATFAGCVAWYPTFENSCWFITNDDVMVVSTGIGRWVVDIYRGTTLIGHHQNDATWVDVYEEAMAGDRVVVNAYGGRNGEQLRVEAHSIG